LRKGGKPLVYWKKNSDAFEAVVAALTSNVFLEDALEEERESRGE